MDLCATEQPINGGDADCRVDGRELVQSIPERCQQPQVVEYQVPVPHVGPQVPRHREHKGPVTRREHRAVYAFAVELAFGPRVVPKGHAAPHRELIYRIVGPLGDPSAVRDHDDVCTLLLPNGLDLVVDRSGHLVERVVGGLDCGHRDDQDVWDAHGPPSMGTMWPSIPGSSGRPECEHGGSVVPISAARQPGACLTCASIVVLPGGPGDWGLLSGPFPPPMRNGSFAA